MSTVNNIKTRLPKPSDRKPSKPLKALEIDPREIAKVLVVGIGNCGRSDDGLGWAFLDELDTRKATVTLAYRYQLQIEDAEKISHHPVTIFVDASHEVLPDGFRWQKCKPTGNFSFSTHALAPEAITGLCRQLYGATPQVYILAIQGHEWGLGEGLSPGAQQNLLKALNFFEAMITP